MNTKRLIKVSIFALISASTAQAADVMVPHQPVHVVSPAPAIVAPSFTWTGFYLGAQVSNFSSKTDMSFFDGSRTVPLSSDFTPKPSGITGGLYAGSNIDLGDGFSLGVDTDFMWFKREQTKNITLDELSRVLSENTERGHRAASVAHVASGTHGEAQISGRQSNDGAHGHQSRSSKPVLGHTTYSVSNIDGSNPQSGSSIANEKSSSVYSTAQIKEMVSSFGFDLDDDSDTLSHTLKQNWMGATRIRVGFAADRIMPYVAGGIAYTQLQDIFSVSIREAPVSQNLLDETKTLIGYTLGGGLDFAMTDNVVLRAEYRYSDFGKKKFAQENLEISYKTNDFRVGVAYKF